MAVTPERRVRRRPDLAFRTMDAEAWVLSTRDQSLHRLNPSAAHLWGLLEAEPTVASLGASLCAHFQVEPEAAARDVATFVGELQERGLIDLVDLR